jgi:hypothetical protein
MFGMFQRKGMGFQQIQRKKRLDRALQLVCIGTLLTGVGVVVKSMIRFLAHATGQRQSVLSMGMVLSVAAAMKLRQAILGNNNNNQSKTTTTTSIQGTTSQ